MQRLPFAGNFCDITMCSSEDSTCIKDGCSPKRVWEQLKAYEDTGLSPEEVKALQSSAARAYYDHDVSGLLEED